MKIFADLYKTATQMLMPTKEMQMMQIIDAKMLRRGAKQLQKDVKLIKNDMKQSQRDAKWVRKDAKMPQNAKNG